MDRDRLRKHVRICRRNLRNMRVKCCAECPFEEELTEVYPELTQLFEAKRAASLRSGGRNRATGAKNKR